MLENPDPIAQAIVLGILLIGIVWVVRLNRSTEGLHHKSVSSRKRPDGVIRMNQPETKDGSNFGDCKGPMCQLIAFRCALGYCGVCCAMVHKNIPWHIGAPPLTGITRKALPIATSTNKVETCFCGGVIRPAIEGDTTQHSAKGCVLKAKSGWTVKELPARTIDVVYSSSVPGKATLKEVTEDEGIWPKWYAYKMKGFDVYKEGARSTAIITGYEHMW